MIPTIERDRQPFVYKTLFTRLIDQKDSYVRCPYVLFKNQPKCTSCYGCRVEIQQKVMEILGAASRITIASQSH